MALQQVLQRDAHAFRLEQPAFDPDRVMGGSIELSDGVAQVSAALNHLADTSQHTAAASEGLSSTAEQLSTQAGQLQQLMAGFRLTREDRTAGPARGLQRAGVH